MLGMLKIVLALVAMSGVVSSSQFVNLMSMQMMEAEIANEADQNLPDLIKSLGLTDLYAAVGQAKLVDALSGQGPFTVFGPTNEAFGKIPEWLKKILMRNVTLLKEVLEYHVLPKKVVSSEIQNELLVNTLIGRPIRFNIYPAEKPYKVYTAQCAPIDLNEVDKMASNGVLHELKSVMVPPVGPIGASVAACMAFSNLTFALKKAGLVDVLNGEGPFTVFAPTDAAFKKLNPQVLDNLLKNVTLLTDVLKYHVAQQTYCSSGLVLYKELETLNGKRVMIKVENGKVKVDKAAVLKNGADGSVTNGVVHAIDSVLIPPSLQL